MTQFALKIKTTERVDCWVETLSSTEGQVPQRPFCVLGGGEDGEREKESAGRRWVGELIIVIFN